MIICSVTIKAGKYIKNKVFLLKASHLFLLKTPQIKTRSETPRPKEALVKG
jgi:hypothetical protein